MFVEVGFQCELATASRTAVALDDRVGLHMSAQVGSVGEGLAAVGAAVGPFARV